VEQERRNKGEDHIRKWPCQCNNRHIAARATQALESHGDWLGPAEQEWGFGEEQDRRKQDRSERINVLGRIERYAA
jgi:hypothetical protein